MRILLLVALAMGLLLGSMGVGIHFCKKKMDEVSEETGQRFTIDLKKYSQKGPAKNPEMKEVLDVIQKRHTKEMRDLFDNLNRKNRKSQD